MAAEHVIDVDLAQVFSSPGRKGFLRTLAWGEPVEVLDVTGNHVEVRVPRFVEREDGSIEPQTISGFIAPSRATGIRPREVVRARKDNRVLRIDFVDVQQGDGSVIETPAGKVILIDGGDNQLFARYLASRYRGTSAARPKEVDCILITHGDADHFLGLTEIHRSETHPRAYKRLFIHPQRVYHNGLVKRPATRNGRRVKETELLGATRSAGGMTIVTGLETNLLRVPETELNEPFRRWKAALLAYRKRGPIHFRRLSSGAGDAFDFMAGESIAVEVLGPLLTRAGGVEGLKFLRAPRKGPRVGHEALGLGDEGRAALSASHTINGHSIVLRLRYHDFTFLFAGDLNDEAGRALTRAHNRGDLNLQAEVFKVPHHGSADFSGAFLQAVSPVISVVSSGDESARKEYIHPRATLMGALGRFSRLEEPLVFVTELVAFFRAESWVTPELHRMEKGVAVVRDGQAVVDPKARKPFFAFNRTAFGIVMLRTDGKRLIVYTNSGQVALKEAYAYVMGEDGKPRPVKVRAV
jgi:beta-lactamase superfamily II metal-dependent hydrolase